MAQRFAAVTGVHGYVPEHVLTNRDLEQMVDTSDEWIRTRTGIRERRILKKEGWAASDIGVQVVNGLLEKTGTGKDEVDLVICGTVTGDRIFPDTANTICDKAGIDNAFGFDINAACSGFLFSLTAGAQFIQTGAMKKVIVLGIDVMSSIIDYEDRATCVIFGDGGGGVLLEPTDERVGLMDFIHKGDGSGRKHLHMKAGGSLKPPSMETVKNREHYVYQEGRPVFKAAVKGMVDTVGAIMKRNDLENDGVDWLVPHQANLRIITSVADALDFPMEKVMVNIDRYGNTTSGTLPLCLWEWEPKLRKGQNIILTSFGGGYTWGSTYLKWGYTK